MAVTRKSNVAAQIPQIWAADLYAEAEDLTFWQRFEGPEGSSMPVIRKDELEKEPGDTIKFDIVLALTGAGVTGDTTALEGNEEQMKFRQQSMTVDALAHAVRWTKLARILMTHNMRTAALNQLSKWLAGKLDTAIFTEFTGASVPTQNKFFAGTATSIGTVDNTAGGGQVSLDTISDLKAFAQSELRLEPLRIEGGDEFFGIVLHPYAALALKKSADFKQAQREARERGIDNPLFRGALAMWDGVIFYTSNRVPRANDGAAGISVARNIFFGAQALVRGYAYYPDWVEQEFDYGREIGVATYVVNGQKLNVFDLSAAGDASDNTAIGSMLLYASSVAPTA
jgi:N4-gp56 family major capsid protein